MLGLALALALAATGAACGGGSDDGAGGGPGAGPDRPNVLFVLTDDMVVDDLAAMQAHRLPAAQLRAGQRDYLRQLAEQR